MATYYRIGSLNTAQSLWYDQNGNFTGSIHDKYTFCRCTSLEMPFDSTLTGWLSATESIEELLAWFPVEDILRLEQEGFRICIYEATDVKFYEPFQHNVISQATSVLIGTCLLKNIVELELIG